MYLTLFTIIAASIMPHTPYKFKHQGASEHAGQYKVTYNLSRAVTASRKYHSSRVALECTERGPLTPDIQVTQFTFESVMSRVKSPPPLCPLLFIALMPFRTSVLSFPRDIVDN